MSLPLEQRLRVVLEEEATRRAGDVLRLLEAFSALDAVHGLPVDEDTVARVEERRARIARHVTELLADWARRGGSLDLQVPDKLLVEIDTVDAPPSGPPRPRVDETLLDEVVPELPRLTAVPSLPPSERLLDDQPAGAAPSPALAAEDEPTEDVPASVESLERLKSFIERGGALRGTSRPAPWRPVLRKLLSRLVPVDRDEEEIERLAVVIRDRAEWKLLPQDVQRRVLGLIACRLRVLQDEHGAEGPELDECFSQLTHYSATERPGFVWGLSRGHKPEHGTWDDDADVHWDALAALLPENEKDEPNQEKHLAKLAGLIDEIDRAPQVARDAVRSQAVRATRQALEIGISSRDPRLVRIAASLEEHLTGRSFRTLRRAIRESRETDEVDADGEDDAPPLPPEWAWWGRTRGRRAVMIGGSPREQNRQRLEEAFGFASLEWVRSEHGRNSLIGVRDRVRAGSVDLVLILTRFVGHNADDVILPACKDTGTPWASVEHGYGVVRIRQAIERFVEAAPAGAAAEPEA